MLCGTNQPPNVELAMHNAIASIVRTGTSPLASLLACCAGAFSIAEVLTGMPGNRAVESAISCGATVSKVRFMVAPK
jgi:hypothetical protein